jgi:hypothetical protein
MWTGVPTLAEDRLQRFDEPPNRPHPKAGRAATLATEQRAHIRQDGVGQVEEHLERPEPEDGGELFRVGQVPQHLRDSFSAKLH